MILFLFFGCADPDFGDAGRALEAYDRGTLSMRQGDASEAVEAFSEAVLREPNRPVLRAWEAHALVAAGANGRALSRLNEGLSRFPDDAVMRHQRAALFAQSGNLAGSAADLRWLYANDEAHPILIGEDPDFLQLKTDPLYSELVPDAVVDASVSGEGGSVLVGDTYTVEFSITSRTGAPIHLSHQGQAPEWLVLQRIVEDVISQGEIWTRRLIRAEYKALKPGRVASGPWLVEVGKSRSLTERLVVEVVAIPVQRELDALESLSVEVPSTRWHGKNMPFLGTDEGADWAVFPSRMSLSSETSRRGPRMEYREGGQPVWSAHLIDGGVDVEIRERGEPLLRWVNDEP